MKRSMLLAAALVAAVPAAIHAQTDKAAQLWASGDYAAAVAIWVERKDDPDAMYNLGQAYRLGRGVPQSIDRAIEYYRAAAHAGNDRAAEQLGLIYYDRPEKRAAAVTLLKVLADKDFPRSAYIVGLEYLSGGILPADASRALYYLRLASDKGITQAEGPLAELRSKLAAANEARSASVPVAAESPPPPPKAVAHWTMDEVQSASARAVPISAPAAPDAVPQDRVAASPGGDGRYSLWFGPFHDDANAMVKFRRMAARTGLKLSDARFEQGPNGGVVIRYGIYDRDGAQSYCDQLNGRRIQCRGVRPVEAAAQPAAVPQEVGR